MWNKISIDGINAIEKCVAEFQVWAHNILPYGKMKIKIYENEKGEYKGYTDVKLLRLFDNTSECGVGHGNTIEKALQDTIEYFIKMVNEDYPIEKYPDGISKDNIEYSEYNDF